MKYCILFLAITFYVVQVSNGGHPKGKDHGHDHGHGHGHGHGHKGDDNGKHSHKGNHGDHEQESHNEIQDHKKDHDHEKNHKHKECPHGPDHPSHNEIPEEGATGGHHCSGAGPEDPIYEKMHGIKPPGNTNEIYDTLRPQDPAYEVLVWQGNKNDYSHYDKLPKPLKVGEPLRPPSSGMNLYEELKYPPYNYDNLNYPCHCKCGHRVGSHEDIYEQIKEPSGPLDSYEGTTRPPIPIRPHDLGCSQSVEQSSPKKGKYSSKSFRGRSLRKSFKKH